MPNAVRALRGATTCDVDSAEQIASRTTTLLQAMFERNAIEHDDLISIMFTATADLVSAFPAAAARAMGYGDVPLMCAQEIPVTGSKPRCIRVMVHFTSDLARGEIQPVYLEDAVDLRDDLPT